jgi:hypothetical protein
MTIGRVIASMLALGAVLLTAVSLDAATRLRSTDSR